MEINTNYRNSIIGSNKVPYFTKEKNFANNLDEKVNSSGSSVANSYEKVNPSGMSVADSYEVSQNASYMNNHLNVNVCKPIYEDENYIVYGPAYNPQGILSDKVLINNKKDGSVIFLEDLKNPTQFTDSLLSYISENKLNFAQLEKHIIENTFNSLQTDNLFYDFVKSVGEVQIKRKEYTTIVDNCD